MALRAVIAISLLLLGADEVIAPDLRPDLDRWSLTAREQGRRGTCSVFAITEAIEFAVAKHEGKGTRLSVEFLNWASNETTRVRADGGFFHDLWKGFERFGICDESAWPYAADFDASATPTAEAIANARTRLDRADGATWSVHWIKTWNVTTGLSDAEVSAIAETLEKGLPVCAGMRWPTRATWSGPRLDWADAADVFDGHSVLLVGHRPDAKRPGERIFLVRNSSAAKSDIEIEERYLRAYVNDAMWIELAPPTPPAKPLPSTTGEGDKP